MISFHTNHRLLLVVPVTVFTLLSLGIAWVPAMHQKALHADAEAAPVPAEVARGRAIYQAEGCAFCHTQQVRQDTRRPADAEGRFPPLEQDARYGAPSRPKDYGDQDPPFLGTGRTGPDLQNVGVRLPSADWHYTHLFDPRAVVPRSKMPAYRWYFHGKADRREGDRRVLLSVAAQERLGKGVEVWATPDAQALIAYLLSLKPVEK